MGAREQQYSALLKKLAGLLEISLYVGNRGFTVLPAANLHGQKIKICFNR
jgi:hypothetical protein